MLIEKEIRLLLPAFAAALALAIVPVWLLPLGTYDYQNDGLLEASLFLFGIVLLVLSSYGREIGLKTVPFILAQPLERARIWWTKIEVLAVMLSLAFDAWLLSVSLCSSHQPARLVPPEVLAGSGLIVVVLAAGGLWMTLLLRQIAAAFWLTILIPMAAIITVQAIGGEAWISFTGLSIYAVAGFFLAHRQFLHIQDTAWTGGVISLQGGRAAAGQSSLREHRPWAALFRKELQLQQFTLAGMAALFVLHLGVVVLRKAGAHFFSHAILSALEMFGVVWLFVPLLAGGQSVAEERQFGTMDALLCLPLSRRLQFFVKLIFVLVIGGLLSAALLCSAEGFASAMGAWSNLEVLGTRFHGFIGVSLIFLTISLVGFYASTLTRGLVPALAAGMVAAILFLMIDAIASHSFNAFGGSLWPAMGPPALTVAVIWLAFGNFRWVFESGRRWRRNIFGLIALLVLVCGSASALYHRVWEWTMPLEVAHGPARILAGKPVRLHTDDNFMSVVLPDGRLWVHFKVYKPHGLVMDQNYFVNGSNWVDASSPIEETVGLQSDGTLWVSENPKRSWFGGTPSPLVKFGTETDWQGLARLSYRNVTLLKRDGTLWQWGTNHISWTNYDGLRTLTPLRLGADSDWARILRGPGCIYTWKKDGRAWTLHELNTNDLGKPPPQVELAPGLLAVRVQALDHVQFQSVTQYPANQRFEMSQIGVRDDGTLWFWNASREWPMSRRVALSLGNEAASPGPVQIGHDSNWVAVASGFFKLVALKTDGSIWTWKFDSELIYQRYIPGVTRIQSETPPKPLQQPPVRLGTHQDWVALGAVRGITVTLAADGTLWRWPGTDSSGGWSEDANHWLGQSRKPVKLENILGPPQ
jgi:ABC-type transport system involved in multi-copper enzyme maturation permease subunit